MLRSPLLLLPLLLLLHLLRAPTLLLLPPLPLLPLLLTQTGQAMMLRPLRMLLPPPLP